MGHVAAFAADLLASFARAFDHDLEQALLLSAIGQMTLGERVVGSRGTLVRVSASYLARTTGIPRQTVRRKLALLEARGWIIADARGGWSLNGGAVPCPRSYLLLLRQVFQQALRLSLVLKPGPDASS